MTKIAKILQSKNKEKLVCLTAYTYPVAKILDDICDIILVGDSLGMAIYGMEDTIDVNIEMMRNHASAVTKAAKKSLIVVDLPFNSYEFSNEQALESAQYVIENSNCDAIKIEVTPNLVERVKFLTANGINVMGHVGLLPQHVRKIGGYKYQGQNQEQAQEILQTAKAIEEAGAFAIVIEAVPDELARKITQNLQIPTIGIGASIDCDGQILVIDDLLGLNQEFTPKFVKKYANLADEIKIAAQNYQAEVRNKIFPGAENLK